MTDKNPASLTSSLLARKGDAAPSQESEAESSGPPEISAAVEGTPVEPDAPDSFLTRGPDEVTPEPQPDGPSWDSMVNESASGSSRWRRAPLLVLAVLLVFVLAGVAWFAASLFMDDNSKNANSMAKADASAPANSSGQDAFQRASGRPLPPAGSIGQAEPQPKPPAPIADTTPATATVSVAPRPPAVDDPVTTDPQDAPRIGSEPSAQARPDRPTPAPALTAAPATPTTLPPPTAPTPAAPTMQVKPAAPSEPPKTEMAMTAPAPEPVAAPPVTVPPVIEKPPATAKPKPVPMAKPKPPVRMAAKPTGTYAVQLSSVKSPSIAQREMQRLNRRFRQELDGTALRVRTADLGRRGKVFRIQTAAVLTSGQAKRMCGRLKSRKQPCFVVAR